MLGIFRTAGKTKDDSREWQVDFVLISRLAHAFSSSSQNSDASIKVVVATENQDWFVYE
jgi:hypothetical protein